MRAEDIVGVSFFGLLIPAIVVAISGSRITLTPRQRALWRGWGLSLICGAMLAFGFVNFSSSTLATASGRGEFMGYPGVRSAAEGN